MLISLEDDSQHLPKIYHQPSLLHRGRDWLRFGFVAGFYAFFFHP